MVGNWFVSQSYTGPSPIEVCIENCYFDSQIAGFDHESWGLSTRELTSRLPNGFDTEKWTKESGKYPVLYTGMGSQARELSSLPLILRDVDDSSKVKVEFSFASSPNVTWELDFDEETGETAAETKALKITGNKVVVKDQYSNSIINAVTADNWGIDESIFIRLCRCAFPCGRCSDGGHLSCEGNRHAWHKLPEHR